MVLGQLGNRVQHALRAFTPKDQKAVRSAAQTFRANPSFDVEEKITQLGVGEALVSTLRDKGVPSIVEDTLVRPPQSRMGPATDAERKAVLASSPVKGLYDVAEDRESAYEKLAKRADEAAKKAAESKKEEVMERKSSRKSSNRQGLGEALLKSVIRSAGSKLGRDLGGKIIRGILGGFLK